MTLPDQIVLSLPGDHTRGAGVSRAATPVQKPPCPPLGMSGEPLGGGAGPPGHAGARDVLCDLRARKELAWQEGAPCCSMSVLKRSGSVWGTLGRDGSSVHSWHLESPGTLGLGRINFSTLPLHRSPTDSCWTGRRILARWDRARARRSVRPLRLFSPSPQLRNRLRLLAH